MRRIVAAIMFTLIAWPALAASYEGRLAYIDGKVTVNGQPAAKGQLVKAGDVIRTATESRADFLWGKGRASRLMANSQLKVTRADHEQHCSLAWGGLLSVLRVKGAFHSASANAVAAVTGTVFYHEESKDHPGYVCVCEGSVKIGHPGAPTSHVPIAATNHKAVHADKAGHKPAGMYNHTDADVAALDNLLIHQAADRLP